MDGWPSTDGPGYSHTQRAPFCLILYGTALACFGFAWMASTTADFPGTVVAITVALVMILLAPAFHHLTVEDEGDVLAIRIGPLPLFRTALRYDDIEKVEIGRTLLLEGGGIHYSFRKGWVWKLWGRACVEVYLNNGRMLRIGTDDAENLARFLEQMTGQRRLRGS
jgi:hypothetical protein